MCGAGAGGPCVGQGAVGMNMDLGGVWGAVGEAVGKAGVSGMLCR